MADDLAAGYHFIEWDGKDRSGRTLPAGVYFARIATPTYANSRQIVKLR
ncbi:MAG: hypothetical protein R3E97_22075 [Candidatus Eisenbacteria bacterium]